MQITLLSHFYNEEYFLPWWLTHHMKIFDNIILINYHSTDKSVEIIKSICPDCKIIDTKNESFSAEDVDKEIMEIESTISGYKICLNTTEFLLLNNYNIIKLLNYDQNCMYSIERATIVDSDPSIIPSHSDNLTSIKNMGFFGDNGINGSCRYIHSFPHGSYVVGRHQSHHPNIQNIPLSIFWYGFSPWTDEMIKRKLQIIHTIPDSDKQKGFGVQHVWNLEKITEVKDSFISRCKKLL